MISGISARRVSLLALFALCAPIPATAQQALVRSYENPALSIGQAYLARYGDQCIALLPEHVSTEAGLPAFLAEGSAAIGEAGEISNIGDDLAVAEVAGNITLDCGSSLSTLSRAVDNLLRTQGLAALRSVNSDGTVANQAVAVVDNDGKMFLRVRPTHDKVQIRKGHSGSLLMIDDRPVGMLLAVSARHGIGKVLRFDTLLEKVEAHMSRRHVTTQNGGEEKQTGKIIDLAAAAGGGTISGWNTLPVDNIHRAINLVADDKAPHWRSQVDQWPAEIEIDLAGEKVAISRIELDAQGIDATGELPRHVEILVNTSRDGRRWRSLLSRDVEFDNEGNAIFRFAPTWARHVRLVFSGTRDSGNTISLQRIRVSNP